MACCTERALRCARLTFQLKRKVRRTPMTSTSTSRPEYIGSDAWGRAVVSLRPGYLRCDPGACACGPGCLRCGPGTCSCGPGGLRRDPSTCARGPERLRCGPGTCSCGPGR